MKKTAKHITDNIAEYYILFVIVIAIPATVSMLTSIKWGLLLSFVLQAVIGVLYIRGSVK